MGRLKKWLIFGLLFCVVVGSVVIGYSSVSFQPEKASAKELGPEQRLPTNVQVAEVRLAAVEQAVPYSGSVQPVNQVNIIAKVTGRIEELKVDVGDVVKKGDVIARLESGTLRTQVDQAEAALKVAELKLQQMRQPPRWEQVALAQAAADGAQARLDSIKRPLDQNQISVAKAAEAQARAVLEQAQSAYDKIAWFDGKGAMPQSLALQQATIAYESARAGYEEQLAGAKAEDIRAAQASVDQAKAQLSLAKNPFVDTDIALAAATYLQAKGAVDLMREQLQEATIVAPMDGVISQVPVSVGALAGPTAPVASMVSKDVEVVFKVEESRIGQIKEGQSSTVTVSAFPDQKFTGKVTRISPTADPTDRTFEVRLIPEDKNNLMRGGMFAEVNLVTEQHANALLIPGSALVKQDGKNLVYVVLNDKVEPREVKVGLNAGDSVQVVSGLALGEQVVTSGQAHLQPGDTVKVVAG
jgi:HlyD family secretion protein